MGKASAVPDHLTTYSDQTARAGSDLQTWVRKVLVPAIEAYRAGARDAGGNIPGLTDSGTTVGYHTIAEDVLVNLNSIRETDGFVRRVGDAFARADRGGKVTTSTTAAERARQVLVSTTDEVLDRRLVEISKELDPRQVERSKEQGRQLADYVNKHGVDQHVYDELAKHKDDGYFTGSFLNGLDDERLTTILNDSASASDWRVVIDALSSAFAVKSVDAKTTDVLVRYLLRGNPKLAEDLFKALKDNPAAANGFAHSLSDEQLKLLSTPAYYTSHRTGRELSWPQRQMVANFIEVLAVAVRSEQNPEWAQALGAKVMGHVTGGGTWTATDEIVNSVLLLFAAVLNTAPPPLPGADSTLWARRFAAYYAAQAARIRQWLADADKATETELAMWFAALTANPEISIMDTAARRVVLELMKFGLGEVAKLIALHDSDEKLDDTTTQLRAAAYLVAFTRLVESGKVTQTVEYRDANGKELKPPRPLEPPRVLRLPASEPARSQFIVQHCKDALSHPYDPGYYVGDPRHRDGEPTELNQVFEAVDGRLDPLDPEKLD
jgi:hypothetical protein